MVLFSQTCLVGEELLVDLALVDLLLNCTAGDKAIYSDLLALANTPGTLPGLHVCGGIPVWVINNHPAEQHSAVTTTVIKVIMITMTII